MQEVLDELCAWLSTYFGSGPLVAGGIVAVSLALGLFLHHVVLRGAMSLVRRTKTDLDEHLLKAVRSPLITTLLLAGIFLAVYQLGVREEVARTVGRLVLTLGLALWTMLAMRIGGILLVYASQRSDKFPLVETRTYPLFANLSTVLILGTATYLFLLVWAIDVRGWIASAGILGIALGFAAKDTLSNLFAGVFIVADAPYQLGDYIVLDDGVRGKVIHIGLRSTRLMTRDDVQITVPNAVIGASKIVNQSGGGDTAMRVRIPVSVSYDADVGRVKELLMEIAVTEPNIRKDPAPRVRFRQLGDSGLEFQLLFWIPDPELRGGIVDAVLTEIVNRFRAEGIEIPYPKRDVHVIERTS